MKEPVKLRLYSSRQLLDSSSGLKPYAARVRETLASYVKLSGDRISLEVIDPEPFSPEEDRAAAFGLRGVPYDPTGNRGYFGLVGTNTTDDTDSIPFLAPDREPFLEYDLTRLVYNLAHPAKPVVAVLDEVVGIARDRQVDAVLLAGDVFDSPAPPAEAEKLVYDFLARLLPELAALSEDEYIGISTQLARDVPRLAELRATLRSRMEASPLMDAPLFARKIETAYRTMWQRWCAEQQGRPG